PQRNQLDRQPARRSPDGPTRRRRPGLPAVPGRRALAALGSSRAWRLRRPEPRPPAGAPGPCDPRGGGPGHPACRPADARRRNRGTGHAGVRRACGRRRLEPDQGGYHGLRGRRAPHARDGSGRGRDRGGGGGWGACQPARGHRGDDGDRSPIRAEPGPPPAIRRPVRGLRRPLSGRGAGPPRARARAGRRLDRPSLHGHPRWGRGMSAGTGRIELRDVAVSFPAGDGQRLLALDGIGLTVEPGELVALIGPNGSGKSTLLRVLAGLLPPDRGSVSIDGRRVDGPDPRVGLVFQEPRLLPWRTTAANVEYPLELAGVARAVRDAKVAALLDTVGLTRAAAQVPSQLSGGMRQRAALARTLALEPAVLLLDEPFSALDELTRERLNLELLAIHARTATTIVVVTHSVQEAIFLADRVVVLSERPGRVAADIPIDLPRPRSLVDLDAAAVGETARLIREHLGAGGAGEAAA